MGAGIAQVQGGRCYRRQSHGSRESTAGTRRSPILIKCDRKQCITF